MRIKFRIFDTELNKMIYGENKIEIFDDMIGFRFQQHFEADIPIVMQYTGLKDKNGKEIYEGDVLKGNSFATSMLKGWGADIEQQFEVYEIRYDEASFKTFNNKGEWVAILNHHVSSKVKDLEVIGTIYEHPHLLKG